MGEISRTTLASCGPQDWRGKHHKQSKNSNGDQEHEYVDRAGLECRLADTSAILLLVALAGGLFGIAHSKAK